LQWKDFEPNLSAQHGSVSEKKNKKESSLVLYLERSGP